MKNSAGEHNAVTDGVLADLFWKLRLRMASRNGVALDIHRLRKESQYRDDSLARATASGDPEPAALADRIRQRPAQLRDPEGAATPSRPGGRRAGLAIAAGVVALAAAAGLYFLGGNGEADPARVANTAPPAARAAPATEPDVPPRTLFRI